MTRSAHFFVLTVILTVQLGCKSDDDWFDPVVHASDVVGGREVRDLRGIRRSTWTKKNVPEIEIVLDEIVLSNGMVTISGTLAGLPGREFVIHPVMFRSALSTTILSSEDVDGLFRLVGDNEFCCVELSAGYTDNVFSASKLTFGVERSAKFSYSYKGFPSNAKVMSDRSRMNIMPILPCASHVRYSTEWEVGVRYTNCRYGFPFGDDYSYVNIVGSGRCLMSVCK